ncbi:DJ-1 family protein [Marinomonas piezotolerans]|uniref:DJ-1 family protein n=1 Tax=Marinomonas piezotolerans TaxID=2213058 RepID=A0A370U8I4_9GAMM|nr:DJ-1 family glyoxalase III [Marinomonas piezotolerans]RDL44084.1 DJ-1 family protein [Marinomonas piezotolerans]
MANVLVPIAQGSEDIETVTIIDVLRRGGVDVTVASIHDDTMIRAARGCRIEADVLLTDVTEQMYDAIVLPGGLAGAEAMGNCKPLIDMLERHDIQDALLAAICAAPAYVLGPHGFVVDKQATCYPGLEEGLTGAEYMADQPIVMDGNILTGQGPAMAMAFSLTVLANLVGYDATQQVADGLLC